jgi:chromate reductase
MARRDGTVHTPVLDLRTMPYYDQDLDTGDGPPQVAEARRLVGTADAVVVSTPSYNGGVPGVLKNALDWLSRPWGDSCLTGMPVAVMSASPGPRGAADALPGLLTNLERSGAVLIEHPLVALGDAETLAQSDGGFTDPSVVALLGRFTDAVHAACRSTESDGRRPRPAAV